MLLDVETKTLLPLFLRFCAPKSRNVTTFAPCSGHTGMTAAHDTHVFTAQHSRHVSGVQNSSTACYGITPKKSSHFSLARVRTLSILSANQQTQAHTNTQYSAYTHCNLLSHMPVTHARATPIAQVQRKTFTHDDRELDSLFLQPFAPQILSLFALSLSLSLFLLTWC